MQNYKAYLAYFSIVIAGVFIYLTITFFIEEPTLKLGFNEIKKDPTSLKANIQANENEAKPLNKELQEPIEMINDITTPPTTSNENENKQDSAILTTSSQNHTSQKTTTYPKNFVVKASVINVRSMPNTQANIIKRFKKGAIISIIYADSTWAKLENGGYVLLSLLKEQ